MSPNSLDGPLRELYGLLLKSLQAGAGGPFVAGVLMDGALVGRGTNTVVRDHDVTRHAEMNALGDAGARLGQIHLRGAVLLTSHLPCLMCYHALKWAGIRTVRYVFDYGETESLFGFRGDARFLADLRLDAGSLERDPTTTLARVTCPATEELYRAELPRLWLTVYRERLGVYDV
jgi:tRNA(Arg) A34 adenosine deaminase TadA